MPELTDKLRFMEGAGLFDDLALLSAAGVGAVGLLLLSPLVASRINDSRAAATDFQPKMEHEDAIVVVPSSQTVTYDTASFLPSPCSLDTNDSSGLLGGIK